MRSLTSKVLWTASCLASNEYYEHVLKRLRRRYGLKLRRMVARIYFTVASLASAREIYSIPACWNYFGSHSIGNEKRTQMDATPTVQF